VDAQDFKIVDASVNVNLMLIELIIYGFDPIEEIEVVTSFKLELLPF